MKKTFMILAMAILTICIFSGCTESRIKYIKLQNEVEFEKQMRKEYQKYGLMTSIVNQHDYYLSAGADANLEQTSNLIEMFDKTIRFIFAEEQFKEVLSYNRFAVGDAVRLSCNATALYLSAYSQYEDTREQSSAGDGSSCYFYSSYYKWSCAAHYVDTYSFGINFYAEFTEDGTYYYFEGEEPTDDISAFATAIDERLELARAEYEAEKDAA